MGDEAESLQVSGFCGMCLMFGSPMHCLGSQYYQTGHSIDHPWLSRDVVLHLDSPSPCGVVGTITLYGMRFLERRKEGPLYSWIHKLPPSHSHRPCIGLGSFKRSNHGSCCFVVDGGAT